jgi:hypothetical protein
MKNKAATKHERGYTEKFKMSLHSWELEAIVFILRVYTRATK